LYYPIALEAALKMKEVAYIHAEGMPAAEMKHGPLALVDNNMPVIFLYSKHQACKRERIEANIQEIISRKGRVLLITDESFNIPNIEEIEVPHVRLWTEQPMVHLMAVQLLAYWVGCERGCEIDKPRNLAKSVTV
jgi:glucosamine--fructose-6-phosphate aminotransferase (isomerizing)